MTTFPSLTVEVQSDRWVVRNREARLICLDVNSDTIRLVFDAGLFIVASGMWKATLGSPLTGPTVDLSSDSHLGTKLLSLVLFENGSCRAVMSGGLIVSVEGSVGTVIEVQRENFLDWRSENGTVVRRHVAVRG